MNYVNYDKEINLGLQIIKEKREKAFKTFLNEIDFHDTFAYQERYLDGKEYFIIYTKYPSIWIGKKGRNLDRLKKLLSEAKGYPIAVEFRDILGEFLSI